MSDAASTGSTNTVDIELASQKSVAVAPAATPAAAPAAPTSEATSEQNTVNPHGYLTLLKSLRHRWTDQPDVCIAWKDLSYRVMVPHTDTSIVTLATALKGLVTKPFTGSKNSSEFVALHPSSGVLLPGRMTLILAPPGHGKTTFLKALSGRMPHSKDLTGTVTYNGRTAADNKQLGGVFVNRLCSFVGQQDLLFPTLTVKETLEFAAKNSIPDPELLRHSKSTGAAAASALTGDAAIDTIQSVDSLDELISMENRRAELLIDLLGLSECSSTIVGNDLLRGVSGGQRKRVSLGEMLLTNSRAYFLDEVTTGLDAAVTQHIFRALQTACRIQQSAVCTALLQPTPETYQLFDDIILLRDGRIVYHGPREDVAKWMWETAGLDVPTGVDEAGFIVDFLTDPKLVYEQQAKEQERLNQQKDGRTVEIAETSQKNKTSAVATAVSSTVGLSAVQPVEANDVPSRVVVHLQPDSPAESINSAPAAPNPAQIKQLRAAMSSAGESIYHSQAGATPVYHSDELQARYQATRWFKQANTEIALAESKFQPLDASGWSPYTKAQYGQPFPHSTAHHMGLSLSRQVKLMKRDRTMIQPRIAQAIIQGIVIGTLFLDLSTSHYSDRMGLMLLVIMFGAFSNLTELPVASEARNVVAKQIDAGFFPSSSYTLTVCMMHIPLTCVEGFILGLLLYWLTAFSPDAGRFFFFMLVMILSSNVMSVFFRSISYVAKNPDIARQMDMPFIILFIIFGGFLITYDKIPNWLVWLYYISPFSWGVQCLALNEFKDPRYDAIATSPGGDLMREGDIYIDQFGLRTDFIWKWMGIVYLGSFYLIFACCNSFLLSKLKPITPMGTRKTAIDAHDEPAAAPAGAVAVDPSTAIVVSPAQPAKGLRSSKMSFQLTALPFIPVTLTWENINYSVEVIDQKTRQKGWRQLLTNINGFAAPGRMTALMGSSGAGKTTLLDCIAGRKTVGKLTGDIKVNGHLKDAATFQRLTGYVEQNDIHIGTATVKEALLFSAFMRLPTSVDAAAREKFVDEVMALLGLSSIQNRLIGDVAIPGLSPGQLKLVTIGVELVANPSVLFLDEPTSGLDAPSAARVMSAVRRIAATGRTVLCTIHQPSEQLFRMFDRLLLLKSGGKTVFFSDCGHKGNNLVNYFEAASGYTEILPRGGKTVLPNGKVQVTLKINPANWMLDVIGAASSGSGEAMNEAGKKVYDYAELWKQSDLCRAADAETLEAATPKQGSKAIVLNEKYATEWQRYVAVQKRLITSHWRNPPMNLTRSLLMLMVGILLGIIYLQISTDDFGGVNSMLGVLFLGLSFPSSVIANSAIPSLFRTRAVYYRETTIGLYGYKTFNATIFVAELPYIVFSLFIFLIPFYFMIGFANDGELFFRFFLMSFLMALFYASLSQMWLALMPNQIILNVINGLCSALFFNFGGLIIKPSSIPIGWKWFHYIDPIPKAFIPVALGQFYCDSSNPGNNCPTLIPGPNQSRQYTYEYLADMLDGSVDDYGKMVGWLILEIFVVRIFILVALKYVSHIKR